MTTRYNTQRGIGGITHRFGQRVAVVIAVLTFGMMGAAMTNAAFACTSPTGVEGEQVYNDDHNVMQYCDGTDWVAMNAIGANTSIISLTTTVGDKVAKVGDTMSGLLTLSGAPTANDHAATKEYVDTVLASGGGGTNGRYQISCASGNGSSNYYAYCVMLDTQTGASRCQYNSGSSYQNAWTDCGAQLNINSMSGVGVSSGGAAVYAANAFGWGQGSVGDGTANQQSTPSALDLNLTFTKIVANGELHTACGLASGKIYCWGDADGANYGYKGNVTGSTGTTNSPLAVNLSSIGYETVTDLYRGYSKTGFKTASGWYGFGNASHNNTFYTFGGNGVNFSKAQWRTTATPASLTDLPTDFTKMSFGTYTMCGLRSNGDLHCASRASNSSSYQHSLGDGNDSATCGAASSYSDYNFSDSLREFCKVSGGHTFTDVAVSGYSSPTACAVANDGNIYCWGRTNSYGQLGRGNTAGGDDVPTAVDKSVSGAVTFEKIYAANKTTTASYYCALDTVGQAYCWGHNNYGQLGTGDTSNRNKPSPVLGSYTFDELTLGENHTCGLTDTGLVYCWGYGGYSALGYGGSANKLIPEPVTAASDYIGISAGAQQTYGWK